MKPIEFGIYERLVDEFLHESLSRHPELRTVFSKIDAEEQPSRYAAFLAKVLEQALREESDPQERIDLCNRIITNITDKPNKSHFNGKRLITKDQSLLMEVTPLNYNKSGIPRPYTSLSESSLFTGSPQEPQLAHELIEEMRSADSVDILVSFIKWSGLRLLIPGFEDLRDRNIPVRLITTSYMGASDAPAVEWIARLPNVNVRISYDTDRTRLHAKAYHFRRNSGYSTAYIGSANMSHAAITSGLEWNLKITENDMEHILEKFTIEFETYWNSREFSEFNANDPTLFRAAIDRARNPSIRKPAVFFDLTPYPFQERILDSLERERVVHNRWKNLVIAATGTGKTVIAAFDFKRYFEQRKKQVKLLFIAHREQILLQARATFCNILRDQNFGEVLTGNFNVNRLEHLFCSVGMLSSRQLWEQVGPHFYDYIIVDEVHHGTAESYRPIFQHFKSQVLLGLTATPERMDGGNVAADFDNHFAAEIRLPEALEEKLLCPFHYFGVADPVAINGDNFWRNGRYNETELENVYVFDSTTANHRLDTILNALDRYEPVISSVKGIGFCVTINHAKFMAEQFTNRGISAGAIVSGVDDEKCRELLNKLNQGEIKFIFTVDKMSEGVDLPDINTVLFLRPTESLTVFLQQLGRGLRHAPEKDCLTVLDFVGQAHRRYRIDSKLKAIMPRHRFSIDKEVELDFPHLPAGCSIQLDRLSRQYVLENIKENISRLSVQVPDRLRTFEYETGKKLSFGNFIQYHDYEPELLLVKETWSGWKSKALLGPIPNDPDLVKLKKTLVRIAFVNGPGEATLLRDVVRLIEQGNIQEAINKSGFSAMLLYYRIWGDTAERVGIASLYDAFERLGKNHSICADLLEILDWSLQTTLVSGHITDLPQNSQLELHAQYGIKEIQAGLGRANLESAGQAGVGVLHFSIMKVYAMLITFQKLEKDFSPSTMYADYPINRKLIHWESQSKTAEYSETGQNLIHHKGRGITILLFARGSRSRNGVTIPFTYLGPAEIVNYEQERPIRIVWELKHLMPAEMFEDNRKG